MPFEAHSIEQETCKDMYESTFPKFIFFAKKDLIQVGQCIAQEHIINQKKIALFEACNEVKEDRQTPFGNLSLSKKEAIQIGVCIGAIDTIYQRYQNLKSGGYSKYYKCKRGIPAIDIILKQQNVEAFSPTDLRELLCHE
jgi:hypothetical protein